jgi:hypothetical protein
VDPPLVDRRAEVLGRTRRGSRGGDALRIGGRQFVVQGRVWEHDGSTPVLRLYLSSGHAESDTVFGTYT